MRTIRRPVLPTCFHEADPTLPLTRRAAVEFVGTLLLMLAATNGGLLARTLGADGPGLARLCSALVTGGALVGLVVALGNASGGHFNPLITALQWIAGERRTRCTLAYIAAQLAGALLGAVLAIVAFGAAAWPVVVPVAGTSGAWGEGIATASLMMVIFGCSRSGLGKTGPFAAGLWLMAAIVATPSGFYANPAITVAIMAAGGASAMPVPAAGVYLLAEITGALAALAVIAIAYPAARADRRPAPAGTDPLASDEAGLITHASGCGGAETAARLVEAIAGHGMTLSARIDHAMAAHMVDLPLRHTELLVFGNPRAGTPLMQALQKTAIDLPLKALVWSDAMGRTWVSYRDPRWLARLYGLSEDTDAHIDAMSAALERVMAAVTAVGPDSCTPTAPGGLGHAGSASDIAPLVSGP